MSGNYDHRRSHPQRPRRSAQPVAQRSGERRPDAGRMVVFGVEPLRELVEAAPDTIAMIYLRDVSDRRVAGEIARLREHSIPIQQADEAALARLAGSGSSHQGVVAVMRSYGYAQLDDILAEHPDPLLLIDGVTDPRNLGALLRSAEGAGTHAAVLARDRTASVTPSVIKSSAGALMHLRIAQCGNVARTLKRLKDDGYWVAVLAPDGDSSLYTFDVARKLVLVVGAEGAGARPIVRREADFLVSIPMRGRVGSLNVSVAAAVALFEIARRRAA